ncbi:MAG TPA: tetratricopeptide repeat protein, partial [Kofleriaceae bacterium]|nr:tetratricopeptide repeat protein [Kofleriaceae bacterium]
PPASAPANPPTPPAAPAATPAAPPPAPSPARPAAKPEPTRVAAATPPKPADKPRRPAPDRSAPRATRAQPIDPYAPIAPAPTKADPAAAYKTGLQQYARGDTTGALATFRSSSASSPGFAPTWRGLGLVYEKLGSKAQARQAFKHYLQLAPSAADADQIRERMERL